MGKTVAYCFMAMMMAWLAGMPAAKAGKTCYCRTATGLKLEIGKLTCLKTSQGMREARCDMVLNNTAWIFTGRQCPVADRDNHETFAPASRGQAASPRFLHLPAPAIFYNVRLAGAR